jgi:hypothetical protein
VPTVGSTGWPQGHSRLDLNSPETVGPCLCRQIEDLFVGPLVLRGNPLPTSVLGLRVPSPQHIQTHADDHEYADDNSSDMRPVHLGVRRKRLLPDGSRKLTRCDNERYESEHGTNVRHTTGDPLSPRDAWLASDARLSRTSPPPGVGFRGSRTPPGGSEGRSGGWLPCPAEPPASRGRSVTLMLRRLADDDGSSATMPRSPISVAASKSIFDAMADVATAPSTPRNMTVSTTVSPLPSKLRAMPNLMPSSSDVEAGRKRISFVTTSQPQARFKLNPHGPECHQHPVRAKD